MTAFTNSKTTNRGTKILGIDPGLGTIGFGVITVDAASDTVKDKHWGVITTTKNTPDAMRLQELYHDLSAIITQYEPDEISIERLFFFKNAKTLVPVSQARGVILLVTAQFGIPVYEYTPMQVKQAATGYGKASKQEVQEWVMTVLDLEQKPRPDDAADALAMAYCHYVSHTRFAQHLPV